MVLDGPTPGKIDVPSSSDKIALSLSELIMCDCVEKRSSSSIKLRHNQKRETPLPLILAMKIHMKTGQKTLVDTLAEQGHCTSYSRTNQIACDLANTAITIWEEECVVFPLQAEKGVFTTGGMDNIDYNPPSATLQITIHGTGISIVQHHSLATISPHQAHRNMINPAVSGKKEKVFVPKTNFDAEIFPFESFEAEIFESGYAWLDEKKAGSDSGCEDDPNTEGSDSSQSGLVLAQAIIIDIFQFMKLWKILVRSDHFACLHFMPYLAVILFHLFLARESDLLGRHGKPVQSAFVWGGLLIRDPLVPSPEEWGWQRSGSAFVPHYISLPPLSSSLPELSFCSCKSVCKRPCKCIVNKQVCISLCFCRGQCNKE
ncbi:hypothetical protein CAPTEDRAFT_188022 [Capitella teleta]|uniref:Uncharacterized protein n=1 Tax=Capitella teleta TaxID=283909 RepID=R7VAH9_CAPTE|nr:hypothetical protein CAPTEDRAFT_188022 [Capitella teleta]|eukprot:ELU12680.1 hypothetical protein CAPTEDRAFT_188022 [Capitella teleta]